MPATVATISNNGNSRVRGSALEKAIIVLDAIASSDHAMSLAELVESLGLPRQTIHRILQSLASTKMILRAPNKDRYVIGPELTRISARALRTLNTQAPVRSVLADLVQETKETCNVGVLDQSEVVYIERLEGSNPLRLQLDVGSRVPFYCTAIGKLLAACQHKNIRTRLETAVSLKQHTPQTIVTPVELEREFSEIRGNDYSINNQEHVAGLIAIAVPIRDQGGKVLAGLAVHGPLTRMSHDQIIAWLPLLRQSAERIKEIWTPAKRLD